jgi:hypothetical protein
LGEHLSDGWFFKFVQQQGVPAFAEESSIKANNSERSEAGFDLRFQTRLLTAQVFVMRHQLSEQAAAIIGLTINRMRPIEPQQFGEFAGIDRIVFLRIFADPR